MIDYCKDCIRNKKIEDIPCNQCKTGKMTAKLEDFILILTCGNCGASIQGYSFYAPCESDNNKYKITITSQQLSNEQIMIINKYTHIPALEIKSIIQSDGNLNRKFYLNDVMEISKILDKNNIPYMIQPEIPYSNYNKCKKRINIHRQ